MESRHELNSMQFSARNVSWFVMLNVMTVLCARTCTVQADSGFDSDADSRRRNEEMIAVNSRTAAVCATGRSMQHCTQLHC